MLYHSFRNDFHTLLIHLTNQYPHLNKIVSHQFDCNTSRTVLCQKYLLLLAPTTLHLWFSFGFLASPILKNPFEAHVIEAHQFCPPISKALSNHFL